MKNNFDSKEELYFSWWLDQLKASKYINRWERNEASYSLTDGLYHEYIVPMKRVPDKTKSQTILAPSVYTPDFIIYWERKAIGKFVQIYRDEADPYTKLTTPFLCEAGQLISVVETKADFDKNNMTRLAKNNIKMVFKLYNVYIDLVKLPSLFNKTFTPDRFLFTDKSLKTRKINYKNVRTLREFAVSLQ